MQISVAGLGPMGAAMAGHLLGQDHSLTGWHPPTATAEPLAARGATVAGTPAEAAATGLIMTSLADDAALEAVTLGPDGILAGLPEGGVHVTACTVSLALADRLAEAHDAAGQHFVAAPVLGRPPAAADGKLFVMAAGKPEAIALARPLLESLGQRVFPLGDRPSQASLAKLACNVLIFSTIEQFGEVFALAEKGGVDRQAMFELLTESFFTAPVHKNYGRIILERGYDKPGVPVTLAAKDTRLALAAGESLGVPLPIASLVRDRLLTAIAGGDAARDFTVIARLCAEQAGLA